MRIGVLAVQGAFREHIEALRRCGCAVFEVRKKEELESVDGLVIPGGESTTIGKLISDFGLADVIRERAKHGMPVFGTCAGAVLLAKEIIGSEQPTLGLMDIRVRRNAYGRQVDSFEADLEVPVLGSDPFPGVFIRAPLIEEVGADAEVLATYKQGIVLVRQGKMLAATFHPELTSDLRLHHYFLSFFEN
ncbi:MAG: Glutamine amidotransferase subunit PdxT [Thermoanaerobacterales bacterium 50_218]|nr:MAG: Glutamine amidotransferase subunit PdxT [Thermoanaerobacterales bacterium 50_218]HAA89716.1 pyridoxal 5'-phosphate synthase glutaminase subunit PdxT [Peptococcaceae bacterium]